MSWLGARGIGVAAAFSLSIAGSAAAQSVQSTQISGLPIPGNFTPPPLRPPGPTVNDAAAASNGQLQEGDPTVADRYARVIQPNRPVGLVADPGAGESRAQSTGLAIRRFAGTLGDQRLTMRLTVRGDDAFVDGRYSVAGSATAVPLTASGDAFAFTLKAPDGAIFQFQLGAPDDATGLVTLRNAVRLDGVWRDGGRELPVKLAIDARADGSNP
jgi:hypothetical protein